MPNYGKWANFLTLLFLALRAVAAFISIVPTIARPALALDSPGHSWNMMSLIPCNPWTDTYLTSLLCLWQVAFHIQPYKGRDDITLHENIKYIIDT